MVVIPNSDIILLKTPFEIDEANTLTFANATAQYNYFISLPKLWLERATYQRKDGVVRWPGAYDSIIQYNYCMYRNTSYDNKWFYAFIEDVKYVNDGMVELKLKTDVFQSWQFDITYKRMFVEREHVSDDTIGKHTIPENLETGDYIIQSMEYDNYNIGAMNDSDKVVYVVSSSLDLSENHASDTNPFSYLPGKTYAGVFSGLNYWGSRVLYGTGVAQKLSQVNGSGQIESIVGLFVAPKWITGTLDGSEADPWSGNVHQSTTPASQDISISKPSTLGSSVTGTYTPKNKKLLTSDYCYLLVNNGAGGSAKYNWELFSNANNATFKMIGVLTPGCSIKLIPNNYEYSGLSDTNSLSLGKYPTLSFTGDMYLNWLTQTATNNQIGIGQALVAGYTDNSSIFYFDKLIDYEINLLKQNQIHSYDPPANKGNINSGDCSYSYGLNRYQFYKMTIKKENAQIIDDFFSAYGYKVLSYKIPNITGRTNWNYVKTGRCNITGNIPQQDILAIQKLFNNGVTFWHNPSTFLDYSQSNTIVT